MKRKTIVGVLAALCFLLLVFIPFILIGTWEEGAKRGFSQVVFMIGVLLGIVYAYALSAIDSRIHD
jgi:riboflavin transporter FmnP